MNEVYVVKRGDTLYGISNQYGVSVTELANLNGVTAETLQVGQTLIIPSSSGTNPDNMFLYTVKKGDSLYSIAKLYNIDVDSIKKLNNLESNNLYIGQVLRIPETYTKPDDLVVPTYVNYTVKRGDSLYSIAKAYNTTVDQIMQDNALMGNNLSVGQNLKIRTVSTNVEECFGEDYTPPSSTVINTMDYVVKKGDNLYTIAQKYNTSVSDIMKASGLTSSNLSIGQVLKIPTTSTSGSTITYTVQKGDSLYSIAQKYNISVSDLMKANNLTSSSLSIGQVLKIPTTNTSGSGSIVTYMVQKGDSLYSIAKKFNTTIDSIKNKNNLKSDNLSIGQVLKI